MCRSGSLLLANGWVFVGGEDEPDISFLVILCAAHQWISGLEIVYLGVFDDGESHPTPVIGLEKN